MELKNNYELHVNEIKKAVDSVRNSKGGFDSIDDICDIPKTSNGGVYASLYNDITLINAGSNNKYRLQSNSSGGKPQIVITFGGENNSYEVEGDGAIIINYGGVNNKFSGAAVLPFELFEMAALKESYSAPSLNDSVMGGSKMNVRKLNGLSLNRSSLNASKKKVYDCVESVLDSY